MLGLFIFCLGNWVHRNEKGFSELGSATNCQKDLRSIYGCGPNKTRGRIWFSEHHIYYPVLRHFVITAKLSSSHTLFGIFFVCPILMSIVTWNHWSECDSSSTLVVLPSMLSFRRTNSMRSGLSFLDFAPSELFSNIHLWLLRIARVIIGNQTLVVAF